MRRSRTRSPSAKRRTLRMTFSRVVMCRWLAVWPTQLSSLGLVKSNTSPISTTILSMEALRASRALHGLVVRGVGLAAAWRGSKASASGKMRRQAPSFRMLRKNAPGMVMDLFGVAFSRGASQAFSLGSMLSGGVEWRHTAATIDRLEATHDQKDDEHEQDEAQTAARVITPVPAVGPSGHRTDQHQ